MDLSDREARETHKPAQNRSLVKVRCVEDLDVFKIAYELAIRIMHLTVPKTGHGGSLGWPIRPCVPPKA